MPKENKSQKRQTIQSRANKNVNDKPIFQRITCMSKAENKLLLTTVNVACILEVRNTDLS